MTARTCAVDRARKDEHLSCDGQLPVFIGAINTHINASRWRCSDRVQSFSTFCSAVNTACLVFVSQAVSLGQRLLLFPATFTVVNLATSKWKAIRLALETSAR